MAKGYDPNKTDNLPAKAQKAFEAYEIAVAEAEDLLIQQWLKLTNREWAATQQKLEEWTADGHRRVELFRHAIQVNEYDRSEL